MMEQPRRGRLWSRGLSLAAITAAAWGLAAALPSSSAQEQDQQDPATAAAAKRGLSEKPLAAGRNKDALLEEEEAARAQEAHPPGMDISKTDCNACHKCEQPTTDEPCLRVCPRPSPAEASAGTAHEVLPGPMVLLDSFKWEERRFMPVPFNHRGHSGMAGMGGGCQICHHHTSKEMRHPPCRSCHKPVFAKAGHDEMRMPSLKGAYHRQCMGCHRDWSHTTKCAVCHLPKGDQQVHPTSAAAVPPPGDIAGHPPIESPENILEKTDYKHGPYVVFRHKEHIERYGYRCEQCHKGQGCLRCHEQTAKPKEIPQTHQERHGACFPCHEDDACERCHSEQERGAPQLFDHGATGFRLSKYHAKLTCRDCHKRLYFIRKLEPECQFCHEDWDPDTFDHSVTGQALDENHADIDCADCHAERKFTQPPRCSECHDKEEASFPAQRPGPLSGAGAVGGSRS